MGRPVLGAQTLIVLLVLAVDSALPSASPIRRSTFARPGCNLAASCIIIFCACGGVYGEHVLADCSVPWHDAYVSDW